MSKIEDLTGIKRSPTRIREFMKSLGIKLCPIGMRPSKANPDVQDDFKPEKLEPRLDEAKKGERAVCGRSLGC